MGALHPLPNLSGCKRTRWTRVWSAPVMCHFDCKIGYQRVRNGSKKPQSYLKYDLFRNCKSRMCCQMNYLKQNQLRKIKRIKKTPGLFLQRAAGKLNLKTQIWKLNVPSIWKLKEIIFCLEKNILAWTKIILSKHSYESNPRLISSYIWKNLDWNLISIKMLT